MIEEPWLAELLKSLDSFEKPTSLCCEFHAPLKAGLRRMCSAVVAEGWYRAAGPQFISPQAGLLRLFRDSELLLDAIPGSGPRPDQGDQITGRLVEGCTWFGNECWALVLVKSCRNNMAPCRGCCLGSWIEFVRKFLSSPRV